MKITKQRLKEIIKEELTLNEVPEDKIRADARRLARAREIEPGVAEADDVYQTIQDMIIEIVELREVINNISMEHGEFVHVVTYARMAQSALAKLSDKLEGAILRTKEM